MNNNNVFGSTGEEYVCRYLEEQGYEIAARNFRIRGGELDIIAKKDGVVAFVEVKTRSGGSYTTGFSAITLKKRRLIVKTATAYMIKSSCELQPRFDAAEVTLINGRATGLDYIENAFDASGLGVII